MADSPFLSPFCTEAGHHVRTGDTSLLHGRFCVVPGGNGLMQVISCLAIGALLAFIPSGTAKAMLRGLHMREQAKSVAALYNHGRYSQKMYQP